MAPPPPTPRQVMDEAFAKAVDSFSREMPLLLHGSGDVPPTQVDPKTVHLVSSLTAQFVARLADAALDSHYMFLNNPDVFQVPPPAFPRRPLLPSKPPPFSVTHPHQVSKPNAGNNNTTANTTTTATTTTSSTTTTSGNASAGGTNGSAGTLAASADATRLKRPRKRLREEYWDEGLPPPRIRSKRDTHTSSGTNNNTTATTGRAKGDDSGQLAAKPSVHEWVGAMGVDLRSTSIRRAHVQNAIATPSFVFPICHDEYAYGRVREIRATKRTLDPLLQDSTVQEMIQSEGRRRRVKISTDADQRKKDDDGEPEAEEEEEEEDGDIGRSWPGIEFVLPSNLINEMLRKS